MRLLVNGQCLSGARTGVGHYATELLRCLRAGGGVERVACFVPRLGPAVRRLLGRFRGRAPAAASGPVIPGTGALGTQRRFLAAREGFLALRFRAFAALAGADLYHEPNFIPFGCHLPTVATVHDLSILLHPHWHPAQRVRFFERNFHRGLGRCAHYFAISDAARQEIVAALGIPPEKITRTYMGVRPGLGPLPRECVREALNRLGLPSQYLLYLGTLEPRKNVLTLLRAYCDLPAGLRERFPMLLVGGLGWNADELADYLDAVARPRGVLRLGYLPDEALAAVYNGARALAFPSLYEGFGLPPVEMLACGGAVLASAIPPVVETAGAAAQLVEPLDVAAWRDALRRVCEDDDWWRSLRRGAVEAARPFTWEQCAADTLAGYRRVLGPSGEASGRRKAG